MRLLSTREVRPQTHSPAASHQPTQLRSMDTMHELSKSVQPCWCAYSLRCSPEDFKKSVVPIFKNWAKAINGDQVSIARAISAAVNQASF